VSAVGDVCMDVDVHPILVRFIVDVGCPLHLHISVIIHFYHLRLPLLHASRSFHHPHFSSELGSSLLVWMCITTLAFLATAPNPSNPGHPKFPQFPNIPVSHSRFSSLIFLARMRVDHSTSSRGSEYVYAEGEWGGMRVPG